MNLHEESDATVFDTKAACQKWIHDRAVRFKMSIGHVDLPNGAIGVSSRKTVGRILDTTVDGYKLGGLDEPLDRYAKPVRKNDKWLAVMMFDHQD